MMCFLFLFLVVQSVYSVQTCKPEIHITFDEDTSDKSGNNHNIMNYNVEIQDGKGIFKKENNSYLMIPQFPEITKNAKTLVIKMRYLLEMKDRKRRDLVYLFRSATPTCSAAKPANDIRIYDWQYGVITNKVHSTGSCQIMTKYPSDDGTQKIPEDFADIVVTFKDEYVGVRVNTASVKATEEKSVNDCENGLDMQCPLIINDGYGTKSFTGKVDEFSLYLCNPDE